MQVIPLKISFEMGERKDAYFPTLLRKDKHLVLVDTGVPGFLPLIESEMIQQGFEPQHLTGVLITHHDIDHMGALAELKAKYPHVVVYALQAEEPYISGKLKSLRLEQAERLQPGLPEAQRAWGEQFIEMLRAIPKAHVDVTLQPGTTLPYLPEVRILPTPGHMPHHISLYVPEQKLLIAADALVVSNGKLTLANPQFTLDMAAAIESVRMLAELDLEKVICFHGGVYHGNVRQALNELLGSLQQPTPAG